MRAERATAGCKIEYGGPKIEITLCDRHRTMMANWYEDWATGETRSLYDMVELIMKEGCRP